MTWRIVTWYRTRRWLRWSVDLAVVLLLVLVVAVAHTVVFNGWAWFRIFTMFTTNYGAC
jgi:hypothetical protein